MRTPKKMIIVTMNPFSYIGWTLMIIFIISALLGMYMAFEEQSKVHESIEKMRAAQTTHATGLTNMDYFDNQGERDNELYD